MGKVKREVDIEEEEVKEAESKVCSYDRAIQIARRSGHFGAIDTNIERIETGIVGLDWLLGGGLPKGRIVEIYGFEGSSKTTIAAECAKAVQAIDKTVLYIDYEHSVDLNYFIRIGVNVKESHWLFTQPFSLEDGMELVNLMVSTGRIGLVIIDSVAAMTPKAELEGTMTDQQIGLQGRLMGKTLRKLAGLLRKTQTVALFINQLRDRIGPEARWNPTVTPGGRALKFWASVRIEVKRKGKCEEVSGSHHTAWLRKQKTCPLQSGVIEFDIGSTGIDRIRHLRQCLLNKGIVENRSGSYFAGDHKLARGELEFETFLAERDKSAPLIRALLASWKPKVEIGMGDGD